MQRFRAILRLNLTTAVALLALMVCVAPAHALSCVVPQDPRIALRGEATPPPYRRDTSDWQPPLVVDGIVLATRNVPVETQLNTGEIIRSETRGEPSALVWIAGTSWGRSGEVAVPGPLVRIWWSKAWGPALERGRMVFEVRANGDRWEVPLCTTPVKVDERPDYEDQRSWRERLGLGLTLEEERALLRDRVVEACARWGPPPPSASPAQRAAALRDLAAKVAAARAPSHEYWPESYADLLRREANALGARPERGEDPDVVRKMRARMATQFDIEACA